MGLTIKIYFTAVTTLFGISLPETLPSQCALQAPHNARAMSVIKEDEETSCLRRRQEEMPESVHKIIINVWDNEVYCSLFEQMF